MKKIFLMASAAILMFCGLAISCQTTPKNAEGDAAGNDSTTTVSKDPVKSAIDQYLTDSIGSQYAQGEFCVPVSNIIETKNTEKGDTLNVWGDFWVYNYRLASDTLKTVSGGAHPGMMSLNLLPDSTYRVVAFDGVADGSDYQPSARRIFGELFDTFQAISSDDKGRDSLRLATTAEYVGSHNIKATMLQDEGWPAVALP